MMRTHRDTETPRTVHPDGFARCLYASVCRIVTSLAVWLVVAGVAGWTSSVTAQQLLDRVVARVGNTAITQTDVDAAVAFGVVQGGQSADGRTPVQQMIDRRLMLNEVARLPPSEPDEAAVAGAAARMRSSAGPNVAGVMKRTGVDEGRLLEMARETLRIQAYMAQRFGAGDRASQQVARWLDDLRARGNVTEVSSRP